jgi:hypothetical protein
VSKRLVALAVTAVALPIFGCGDGGGGGEKKSASPEAQVRTVANDIAARLTNGDLAGACRVFTEPQGCPGAMKELLNAHPLEFPEVKRVSVTGVKAKAEVQGSGGSTAIIDMKKQGSTWKADNYRVTSP